MKYNNTNSGLLSSLACGKNNLLIKNRLDRDKNIDLLYKDDAGIFSAAITRNNHELLQMLLDYMEQSGQMANEHDRLCNVLSKIYESEKYCITKEIKSILYPYISDDMDFEDSFEEDKDGQDINSKIQEVNNNKFRLDECDTSTSEGSDKKKDALDAKLQPDFDTRDFSDILLPFFGDSHETDLSGNIQPDCDNFD